MLSTDIEKKNHDILDVAKFVLSFFVVAIHAEIYPDFLYPWLRIAVPLFFIISSYLFFKNISKLDYAEKNKALWKFVKRNLKLYCIWFVILIPFTVHARQNWFDSGILIGFLKFCRALLLGSTFRASWFITANVVAVLIIFFVSKKIKKRVTFSVALFLYLICCLATSYSTLAEGSFFDFLLKISSTVFDGVATSFIHGLIWVMVGKVFAEGIISMNKNMALIGTAVFSLILFLEHWLTVERLNAAKSSSCYVALVPLCIFIFALLLKLEKISFKQSKKLRAISTVVYVTHCAVLSCFAFILTRFSSLNSPLILFLATSISTFVFGLGLVLLSEKIKILKNLW